MLIEYQGIPDSQQISLYFFALNALLKMFGKLDKNQEIQEILNLNTCPDISV